MEVTITQFRQKIFALVNQALAGEEVWFIHKGKRLKVVPEKSETSSRKEPGHWLDRLTPIDLINEDYVEPAISYQEEIQQAWEKNWADFFDRLP
jgi:hypothetical protein